jgi:hypothetical protein
MIGPEPTLIPRQYRTEVSKIVTVANHFQHGIIIFGPNGEKYVVKGLSSILPAAVWDDWLARHQDHQMVTSGTLLEISRA